jgi:hypothetical protein
MNRNLKRHAAGLCCKSGCTDAIKPGAFRCDHHAADHARKERLRRGEGGRVAALLACSSDEELSALRGALR